MLVPNRCKTGIQLYWSVLNFLLFIHFFKLLVLQLFLNFFLLLNIKLNLGEIKTNFDKK